MPKALMPGYIAGIAAVYLGIVFYGLANGKSAAKAWQPNLNLLIALAFIIIFTGMLSYVIRRKER